MKKLILAVLFLASCSSSQKNYTGLGSESISAEKVKAYAPPSLDSELSRKIQSAMDIRAPGMGAITEDGKKLYFTWKVTGTHQVWRLDGPEGFPIQMTGGEDNTMIAAVSPNGKFLVLSRDRKGEENPGLYLQNADGGPLEVIQHKKGVQTSLEFVTNDSKNLYYRANDIQPDSYAIYRYSIADKKSTLIFSEPGIWAVADFIEKADGNVGFLLEKALGNYQSEFYLMSTNSPKAVGVLGIGERQDYQAQFSAKPGELLVLTPKFSDFRKLYRYSLSQKTFDPITSNAKVEIEGFSTDYQHKKIFLDLNDQGYTKIEVRDASTFKTIALPKIGISYQHQYKGGTTRNGRYTTVGIDTFDGPRKSFVLDWNAGKFRRWVIPSVPEFDAKRVPIEKLEYYTARDGTKIPVFVKRPAFCEDHVCPVIVDFHGGPEGQSQPGFSTIDQVFLDEGFVLARPNVRGSSGYGKKWLDSDNGPKRLDIITDIEDASLFIRKNWKVSKVGVMGGSYGGYSTLMAMTYFAGAYDAGASSVGISNLKTFLLNTAPYRRILRISEYGDPEKDAEALVKLSPVTYVDRVKSPLLITQGLNDPRVPAGEAVQIHEKLRARGIDSQLIIFADEGHGASKRENVVLQYGNILNFFRKHLK